MRNVRNTQEELVELALNALELLLERLQALGLGIDLRHERGGVFLLRLELADLLRKAVAVRLQLLGLGLHRLAPGFERFERTGVQRIPAIGEPPRGAGKVAAQELHVKHRLAIASS